MSNKVKKLTGTIAAQATAPGFAGIAVVRVSGELTKSITKKNHKTGGWALAGKKDSLF